MDDKLKALSNPDAESKKGGRYSQKRKSKGKIITRPK